MSSAGIINFIYNETIVSRALPSLSVDYNWFTGINVWKVRFTRGMHYVVLGKLWFTVYTGLIFFFCCRCGYWGFICSAIFKILLSQSSIFLFKNFSGEFLSDFKISNDSKILIFRGPCSDLINLIFASLGKQCFSEIKWFAIALWPEPLLKILFCSFNINKFCYSRQNSTFKYNAIMKKLKNHPYRKNQVHLSNLRKNANFWPHYKDHMSICARSCDAVRRQCLKLPTGDYWLWAILYRSNK